MDFWSKGLGKRTVAIGLTRGESLLSEEAICLKGTMDEPVSWEYVMLLTTSDLMDFFTLLKEPEIARYIHASPNRWRLYAGFIAGGVRIACLALVAAIRHRFGGPAAERVVIQLPPPSVIKKRKKRRAYRRRLSTTTLAAPTMGGPASSSDSVAALEAGGA